MISKKFQGLSVAFLAAAMSTFSASADDGLKVASHSHICQQVNSTKICFDSLKEAGSPETVYTFTIEASGQTAQVDSKHSYEGVDSALLLQGFQHIDENGISRSLVRKSLGPISDHLSEIAKGEIALQTVENEAAAEIAKE